jgi:predicted DNA-binding transcriptional regulator YafY
MSYSNYLKKMAWLIELLKQENTGCADCLSKKIGVSRRTIFRYLDELRLKGADICFSKCKRTYYLKNNFNFTKDFL